MVVLRFPNVYFPEQWVKQLSTEQTTGQGTTNRINHFECGGMAAATMAAAAAAAAAVPAAAATRNGCDKRSRIGMAGSDGHALVCHF